MEIDISKNGGNTEETIVKAEKVYERDILDKTEENTENATDITGESLPDIETTTSYYGF